MAEKSVLLIGASGLVGNEVLKLLNREPFFQEVIVLTRRILTDYKDVPKIKQIIIDFDRLDDYRESIKAYYIISTLGTTIKKAGTRENFRRVDFSYTQKVAEIAKSNGAAHFLLVSSLGADVNSKVFYNRIKGQVEEAVSALGFRCVSIFRPSILLGKRNEFRLGEAAGKTLMRMFSFAVPKKYKPTEAYQLAAVIVSAARKDQPGVRIYEADKIQDLYYEQL